MSIFWLIIGILVGIVLPLPIGNWVKEKIKNIWNNIFKKDEL